MSEEEQLPAMAEPESVAGGEVPAEPQPEAAVSPLNEKAAPVAHIDPAAPRVEEPQPRQSPAILSRLLGGLWFGAGAFILLIAHAVFAAAGTPTTAANVVGAVLTRWHYLSLAAPALLLLLEWRAARSRVVAVLFAAVLLASTQALVDVRIRQIRAESPVAISSLSREDPVRRQFGILHGISSLLLIAQVLAAAAFLTMSEKK